MLPMVKLMVVPVIPLYLGQSKLRPVASPLRRFARARERLRVRTQR